MNYNKTKLAQRTGLSRITVSQILNGKQKNPKIETLEILAKEMGFTVDGLRKEIARRNKN